MSPEPARRPGRRTPVLALGLSLAACSGPAEAAAPSPQPDPAVEATEAAAARVAPAPSGCAMAHCDTRMSDHANAEPPRASTTAIRWHDTAPRGALSGLGCTSNGTLIACSYTGAGGDNLVAY